MTASPLRPRHRQPASDSSKRSQPRPSSAPKASPAVETLRIKGVEVRLIRSAKRQKSVAAKALGKGVIEARAPAELPMDSLLPLLEDLIERMRRSRRPGRAVISDEDLERRASHWNRTLFGGTLRWRSIRFVSNQRSRLGSCSPAVGTIRLSERLQDLPTFVLDYVIVHELAHLLEPNHSRAFWQLVDRYPQTERARGFVQGWRYAETAHAHDTEEADDVKD